MIMKKFYTINLVMLLLFSVTITHAQDKNNNWQLSFGVNAVDLDADTKTKIPEFFDADSNWNISKSPVSYVSLSKYLENNISFGLSGSFSTISKYVATAAPNNGGNPTNEFLAVDAMFKYDLSDVFTVFNFEPFIGIGPGYTWFEDQKYFTGNLSVGANYWFSDVFGISLMADFKNNYDDIKESLHYDEGGTMRWSATFSVKFGGTDTDGDGIYDQHDKCVDVPGLEEFDGCPDSDSDGVQDSEDDCPLTPGLIEFNGCPDTDGDGLSDNKDKCPESAGSKGMGGCPDDDGDGVINKNDRCPSEAGPLANKGCPWPDSDGDGVVDKDDKCPQLPGPASNDGCPEGPSSEDKVLITELSRGIKFAFGASVFTDGTPPVLDKIVSVIEKYPTANFSVEGHTDSIGTKGFNQSLSEARAKSVIEYLVSRNVSADRMNAVGFGENSPIDTNVNPDGRSKNRRVEIVFEK